jgi:hypothetical protein
MLVFTGLPFDFPDLRLAFELLLFLVMKKSRIAQTCEASSVGVGLTQPDQRLTEFDNVIDVIYIESTRTL